jgi:hypothetical protein
MKVKLEVKYYALLAVVLNQTTIDNENLNAINFASFKELRKLFLGIVSQNMDEPDKKVSKNIPDSYCLLFFYTFNGIPMSGFENVVTKDLCKQVETKLFISGKYKFDNPKQLQL